MKNENVDFNISDVITTELISVDLRADTKKEAIEELTELLVIKGDVTDRQAFIDDVVLRESEGITGLGQGIAIPHGKSQAVKNTSLAIGISQHGIEWESLDDELVSVIILFAVKDTDANTLHIRLLQKVAILLADDNFITKLHEIKDKEELIKLLNRKTKEV
ncbi:PTS sugar transporter subunit IIA [Lactobacillus sp. UCMA15818]|mgnify:CR=1 FL=1|uniref:PTS sugar transporter subunit IIA n=1 Tax=Lactobacillaceae TaxID=33958 RepID=UPI0025B1E2C0|nr:PTS sugar transporter subunit IIA [Lactobacillus sp. UCMA15818]MDN2453723.1 PTS sugar transporter subunit IIA [Lactobacillus sp. UCMA15818]